MLSNRSTGIKGGEARAVEQLLYRKVKYHNDIKMNNYNDNEPLNIGVGEDHAIKEVAQLIADVVEYEGNTWEDYPDPKYDNVAYSR